MSKLIVVAIVLSSVAIASADVVEPGVEAEEADKRPALGPSMVAAQPPVTQDTQDVADETPPLSGSRVVGETLLGGLFAAGGAVGGGYVGYKLELRNGCDGEFCGLGGAILGGMVGYTFAAPVGVYLAGNTSGETGSLGATIGGSVLGSLGGIAIVAMAQDEAAIPFLFIGPVVGSIVGFNATRKYAGPHKRSMKWTPVASVSSGNSTFGVAGAF